MSLTHHQHPNYSRAILKQGRGSFNGLPFAEWRKLHNENPLDRAFSVLANGKKFFLPQETFTAAVQIATEELDSKIESLSELRLPFDEITIEGSPDPGNGVVVAAWRTLDGFSCMHFVKFDGVWCASNTSGFSEKLKGSARIYYDLDGKNNVNGGWALKPTIGLLALLAARGASVNKSPAKSAQAKTKDSLPFDDYHYLVIAPPAAAASSSGVTHPDRCSPREHTRRGHYRNLRSGRRAWVPDCVVSRGAEARINKDYIVKASA